MEKIKTAINTVLSKTSEFLSKHKWPAAIFFAAIITALALIASASMRNITRQPWYTYGNAIWSPDGKFLSYTRESIYPPNAKSKKKLFEIRRINSMTKEQNAIATMTSPSSAIKIMDFSKDGKNLYFAYIKDRKPVIFKSPADGTRQPEAIEIPSRTIGKIIKSGDKFIFSEETHDKAGRKIFHVKKYSITENRTDLLYSEEETEGCKLRLTDASSSDDGKTVGIVVWKQTDENLEGFSSFWLYDRNKNKITKTPITSYGSGMELEISKDAKYAALKTIDIADSGTRKPLIYFYDLETAIASKCFINEEITFDFKLIWCSSSKLFLKTDDKLYLIKKTDSEISAGVIFDKSSFPVQADEFEPSPDGTRLALIKYAQGTNLKSEILISNIDGTDFQKLIQPEGRRNLEGNPVYIYLRYCKLVIIDLIKLIKK